jgi:hypothetical protein
MRLRFTPEAEAQLQRRKRWWRQNRDKAPDLFDREFATAAQQIHSSPLWSRHQAVRDAKDSM